MPPFTQNSLLWLDTSYAHMLNEPFFKTGEEICTRLLKQVVSSIG
jgi:hypothetical protein